MLRDDPELEARGLTCSVDHRPEQEAEAHSREGKRELSSEMETEQGLQPAHRDGGHADGDQGEQHPGAGHQGH